MVLASVVSLHDSWACWGWGGVKSGGEIFNIEQWNDWNWIIFRWTFERSWSRSEPPNGLIKLKESEKVEKKFWDNNCAIQK